MNDAMKNDPLQQMLANDGDEPMSNHSDNPTFDAILQRRASRRGVLGGSLSAAVAGLFAASPVAALARSGPTPGPVGRHPGTTAGPRLGFDAIPVSRSDTAVLPKGYKAQALIPWGTPITGSYPAYDGVKGNTGEQQEQQVGSHHDGMHYFPFADDPNGHGLLCVNHEYVDQRVLHVAGPTVGADGLRPTDEVRKEIAAHGVSVVEIKRDARGTWDVVRGSRHNRRITANTEMDIRGPVRGSALVKTRFSPDGTRTRGTINNCAHGYTPWGTYLTCEENWAGYFVWRVNLARADALLNWFEETQPSLYPARKASLQQGRYYARYYPETNRILGIADEFFDQKVSNTVYTQEGSVFTDAGRQPLGSVEQLLAQAGLNQDIDLQRPREMARFGVPTTNSRYRWETARSQEDQYVRFNASPKGDSPLQDYRNEPNGQGWVVEIDPFDPSSMPVKRTALGRFAHEGCVFAPPRPGEQLAFYMGDDAQNEYIYKFVTAERWTPNTRNRSFLDHGTLYVARFNDDGSGDWLTLDIADPAFRAAAAAKGVEFKDQADVLVNTRLAADVVGATKMDRPEWGAVHPHTRDVYMTLTNNSARTATDAANPRPNNTTGHIIRWREDGTRTTATRFTWDLFALAGPDNNSQVLPGQNGPALTAANIFASPDGLWVDDHGILWIQTDMSGSQQASGPYGENQMLAANPFTGEIKRFLTGPKDQETTGVVTTPDGKTMFVNFQHPGDRSTPTNFTSNWPDHGAVYRNAGAADVLPIPTGPRPRSGTLVITRDDGGVIGL